MAMSFEDVLASKGRLVYTSVGNSMQPLIRPGRDLLIIEPPQGRLKKNDVALYRVAKDRYIIHRVIRVRKHDYVIRGDNCLLTEYGITDRMIIGVLTGLVRDGKELSLSGFRYWLYLCFLRLRYPFLRLRTKLGSLAKRLLRRRNKTGTSKKKDS